MVEYHNPEESYHASKERGTDIDRCTGRCVGVRCDESRDQAHDSITCNRNTIASCSMGRRQHFWRVCVQSAVVDVDEEVDHASECNVLRSRADGSISAIVSSCPFERSISTNAKKNTMLIRAPMIIV